MRRAAVVARAAIINYLSAGNCGTQTAICRALHKGREGVKNHLANLEKEGIAKRSRKPIQLDFGHGSRVEECEVWEWADPVDFFPKPKVVDAAASQAARRASLLQARKSMGELAQWAHAVAR